MIFSYKKLLQIIGHELSLDQMKNAINKIGFEVESIEKFVDIEGIKFGYVEKTYKNPNADKLTVCEIKFADQNRIIQTNATNVKENDYLIAFVPGSRKDQMVFSSKKLKDIESEGMLASINELGFDASLYSKFEHGIFTFGKVDLNLDPMEFFDLNDYLIDISILSNRSDANSYYIMAKEIAAFYQLDIKEKLNDKKNNLETDINIVKSDEYLLTMFESETLDIKLSIQDKLLLLKSGVKLINEAVDLTNLNLIMTGMPTHCYDKNKIDFNNLSAGLYTGKFTMLGNQEVELKNAFAILDNQMKPISLAGIMGSEKTKVDDNSEKIIFEMGIFSTKNVRNTKKQILLDTMSFRQSSKKISLGTLELGYKFLVSHLNKFSKLINFSNINQNVIEFDYEFLNKMANKNILEEEKFKNAKKSLELLGFKFDKNLIYIPTYRHDIFNKEDMVEEFFRFYGYENFIPEQPKYKTLDKIYHYDDFHNIVSSMGYRQVWTYSLVSKKSNIFNPFNFESSIELMTFVSKEREVIRDSIAISLAEVIEYNIKRKINSVDIFDIGMVNKYDRVIGLASTTKSFEQIKNDIQRLFKKSLTFVRATEDIFNPSVSAKIYLENKMIGWIGKIHPKLKISDAYFAEVVEPIYESDKNNLISFTENPLKYRDITFTIKFKESIKYYIDKIKSIDLLIYKVEIIDEFILEESKKITLRILFEDQILDKLEKELKKLEQI